MQTEKLVDVFALNGQRIGRYRVGLPERGAEKIAERRAIEQAIRDGDAGESDRRKLVAFVRNLIVRH